MTILGNKWRYTLKRRLFLTNTVASRFVNWTD